MNFNDQIMRYGVLLRKRNTRNQKLRFLSILKTDFEDRQMPTEIFKSKVKNRESFTLVAGNLDKVKTVVVSHFDNPIWFFGSKTQIPFNEATLRKRLTLQQTLAFILVVILGAAFYFLIAAPIFNDNQHTFMDVLSYAVIISLIIVFIWASKGIAHTTVPTSCANVLVMLNLAQKRKDLAYILVDDGYKDRLGYVFLKDMLNGQKVIALDGLGEENFHIDDESFLTPILDQVSPKVTKLASGTKHNNRIITKTNITLTQEIINHTASMVEKQLL